MSRRKEKPLRRCGKPPFELVQRGEDDEGDHASPSTLASFDNAFEGVVQLLRDAKRIVVLTGAGISVSCGIPDFRTKGSGLYSTLDAEVNDDAGHVSLFGPTYEALGPCHDDYDEATCS
jgi:Sir2 family